MKMTAGDSPSATEGGHSHLPGSHFAQNRLHRLSRPEEFALTSAESLWKLRAGVHPLLSILRAFPRKAL